jgi:hypothetical protein
MEAKRIALRRLVAASSLIAMIVAMGAGGADARPSGSTTTTSGSCSVTPNPAAVGKTYTVLGSRLGAGRIVNVLVTDSAGTQWGSVQTDSTGSMQYVGVAAVSGGYSVKVTDSGRKAATLASCAFSAR